jgi:hypothetical protein
MTMYMVVLYNTSNSERESQNIPDNGIIEIKIVYNISDL